MQDVDDFLLRRENLLRAPGAENSTKAQRYCKPAPIGASVLPVSTNEK